MPSATPDPAARRAGRGRPPGPRLRYRLEVVAERHLDRHDRRRLGALLADAFGDEEVRRRAHYGDPPDLRVIVRHRGRPVAQASVLHMHATPRGPRVLGLGDVAVHPDHRGRGLAGWVVERALELARAARPDLIVVRTDPLRRLFGRSGFVAIDRGRIPALEPYENWMAWTPTGEIPWIEALDPADV